MTDRVLDPVIAQQSVWIIAGIATFPPIYPTSESSISEGMYHEIKQAHIGLRLTDSGPETPSETVRFQNDKKSD